MMRIHELKGCAPAPLAHYLKALGILRLVAEQADPQARGWWEGERFKLATRLVRPELERFFLEEYAPTPLVAPWNGGTGFYPKDKKAKTAVHGLLTSASDRFKSYREAIVTAQTLVGSRRSAPEKKEKEAFIGQCLMQWRGGHHDAMQAAIVLSSEGKPAFPALLGTGFNDGRLDFTSNFMERLLSLFTGVGVPKVGAKNLLNNMLWGEATPGLMAKGAIGQFFPGNAGGANSTNAPNGEALSNPWDFIFMLEGAVLFVAHATRRLSLTASSRAAAPFAVNAQGSGYSSSADTDESARGEQWMPLWAQPLTLAELRRLLAEGRAQLGAQTTASEPLDLARAIARMGTARGILEFQRYGYIERNGQANLAVPLGRFRVPEKVSPQISCLDDLDRGRWLHRLRVEARDTKTKKAPARLKNAEHSLSDALFAVTQRPENPVDWQAVLLALAKVEGVMASGSGFRAGPIPPLRPEWVAAANDGSAEFRLALAFALQADTGANSRDWTCAVRRHWLPLQGRNQFAKTGTGAQPRLSTRPDVVLRGRSGLDDAIALVQRRLIEAAQKGARRLPLAPAHRAAAAPADLARLLAGGVDLDLTLELARALMALDARRWTVAPASPAPPRQDSTPDDAWLAIRLALLPWQLPDGRKIGIDPAIVRRLESGDAATAFELARRRLRAAGIGATVQCAAVSSETARLWAAALAFPISRITAADFVRRLDPNAII